MIQSTMCCLLVPPLRHVRSLMHAIASDTRLVHMQQGALALVRILAQCLVPSVPRTKMRTAATRHSCATTGASPCLVTLLTAVCQASLTFSNAGVASRMQSTMFQWLTPPTAGTITTDHTRMQRCALANVATQVMVPALVNTTGPGLRTFSSLRGDNAPPAAVVLALNRTLPTAAVVASQALTRQLLFTHPVSVCCAA